MGNKACIGPFVSCMVGHTRAIEPLVLGDTQEGGLYWMPGFQFFLSVIRFNTEPDLNSVIKKKQKRFLEHS